MNTRHPRTLSSPEREPMPTSVAAERAKLVCRCRGVDPFRRRGAQPERARQAASSQFRYQRAGVGQIRARREDSYAGRCGAKNDFLCRRRC